MAIFYITRKTPTESAVEGCCTDVIAVNINRVGDDAAGVEWQVGGISSCAGARDIANSASLSVDLIVTDLSCRSDDAISRLD